jgi:hypothetical protein
MDYLLNILLDFSIKRSFESADVVESLTLSNLTKLSLLTLEMENIINNLNTEICRDFVVVLMTLNKLWKNEHLTEEKSITNSIHMQPTDDVDIVQGHKMKTSSIQNLIEILLHIDELNEFPKNNIGNYLIYFKR